MGSVITCAFVREFPMKEEILKCIATAPYSLLLLSRQEC